MRVSFDICDFVLYRGGGLWRNRPIGRRRTDGRTDSPSPLDSIRDAVLTVSPNRQYLGIFRPTTPAHTGPARGKVNTLLPSQRRRRSHGEPLPAPTACWKQGDRGANQTVLRVTVQSGSGLCSVSRTGSSRPATHCSRSWKLQTARDKNVWRRVYVRPLARQLGGVQAHQHSKKNTCRDDEGRSRSLLLLLFFFFFLAP